MTTSALSVSEELLKPQMLTVAPFGARVGFWVTEARFDQELREILPPLWEVRYCDQVDFFYSLEQRDQEFLWRFGLRETPAYSLADCLATLRQDLQITLPLHSQNYLFLRGCLQSIGPGTVVLTAESKRAEGWVQGETDSAILALGQDHLLRTYEDPSCKIAVQAIVLLEDGPTPRFERMSAAQLASRIFANSPTPLHQSEPWLGVVGRLVKSAACFRCVVHPECQPAELMQVFSTATFSPA